jgi:replicative DNA helicase
MNQLERIPPHSEEAERALLGAILFNPASALHSIANLKINADSFYLPSHRLVWETVSGMIADGKAVDLQTVTVRLRDTSQLERIGGPAVLDTMVDSCPTVAHAEYYAGIVAEKAMLRAIIDASRETERACFDDPETAAAVLADLEMRLFALSASAARALTPWPETVDAALASIEAVTAGEVSGLKTGFADLDDALQCLMPANLYLLAARPSMGKTSLAMNIVENLAAPYFGPPPVPVCVFSLEMSQADLARRLLCSRSRHSSHVVMQGRVAPQTMIELREAAAQLREAPITLDDSAALDIADIRSRARRYVRRYGCRLIVVDYLGLAHAREAGKQSREREVSAIFAGLKAMAKELSVPVLALSQLNRLSEHTSDGVPRQSDLRDSGSLEQDADVVMLLRRPRDSADPDFSATDPSRAVVDLSKNRNGPTNNRILLSFDASTTRFRNHSTPNQTQDRTPNDERYDQN